MATLSMFYGFIIEMDNSEEGTYFKVEPLR